MTRSDGGDVVRHTSDSMAGIPITGIRVEMSTQPSVGKTKHPIINVLNLPNTVGMILTCLIGLALSGYATYVEIQVEKDDDYEAMCDISEKISCTKVFASRYGKGFGVIGLFFGEDSALNIPNGEMGIMFYILIGILNVFNKITAVKTQLVLAVLSNVMSFYLALLLYFVLDDLCIVCVGIYIVNAALFVQIYRRLKTFNSNIMTSSKID